MGMCAPVRRGRGAPSGLLCALAGAALFLALPFLAAAAPAVPSASCPERRPSPQLFRDYLLDRDLLLVDVRSPTEFSSLGIPGALNVAPHAVKTKAFWKGKRLVLFDQGFGSEPSHTCEELRGAGFSSVSVLQGGIVRWGALGGPLRGEVERFGNLRRISARSVFVERGRKDVLYVEVGGARGDARSTRSHVLAPSLFVAPDVSADELAAKIVRAGGGPGAGAAAVVFLGEGGVRPEDLLTLLRASRVEQAGSATAFFLDGGLEAYDSYAAERSRASSEDRTSSSACGSCR